MIVDTHIHWPMADERGVDTFLAVLDSYGIDRAVVCGYEVLYKKGRVEDWNDRLSEFCGNDAERLVALGTVHLAEGCEKVVKEAERCINTLGMKGFKVHPWLQGETVFFDSMFELCRVAGEHNVPLMFHDGTPVYAMSSQIGVLAKMFPNTVFVLGHSGILHYWEEAIEVGRQFSNVFLTLCGGHPYGLQAICDQIDIDRIMWGSDFTGPGADESIHYRMKLADGLNLASGQRRKIMGENALRLYWG